MKPFIFNEKEYTDLNSLGLAFVEQFDLALQCIQEKAWLKFFKNFKTHKKRIRTIFYQSRYLQSALSMIIYWITDEHILYVGHKRYSDIASCLKDIKRNPAFYYFAEDHGFSNTLLDQLEDEKLKADLKALEENYTDEFSFEYLERFYEKDSLEQMHSRIVGLASEVDPFMTAYQLFSDKEIQLCLARKYSLKEVLDLRLQKCPVFDGLYLVKDVLEPLPMLEPAFYQFILQNYKKFKYKGKEGKELKKNLKQIKKKTKKYAKWSLNSKVNYQKSLYLFYLDWVDLYYLNKVVIKEDDLKPSVPYCHTFIPTCLVEEKHYEQEIRTEEYHPVLKNKYDLNKFSVAIRTHRNFAIWSLVISLLSFAFYFVFLFMDTIRIQIVELLAKLFAKDILVPEQITNTNLFYFIGFGIVVFSSIFILIMRMIDKNKYKKLCKLSYYHKHAMKLKEKEIVEYDVLKEKEAKYSKQIDRFYRFYGGIGMAGLSLCVVLSTLGILYAITPIFIEEFSLKIIALLQNKIYYLGIAPAVCMLLCFLRHKKTAWSVIFTTLISMIAAVGILFLV